MVVNEPAPSGRGARWLQGATAFGLYAVVSFLLWGMHLLPHVGSTYVSNANVGDERFYTWALAWWPYAVGHGLSLFHTDFVWAPTGVNMAWVTGLPGPALLFEPLTRAAGPIVTENLLFVLAPALAGWAAYLVCRRASGRLWPALAGGYVFGFSTYLVGQMLGHLNLVLVFPVPLALYLVLRRLDGDLRRWSFIALLAGVLLLLFSISAEVFATGAFVGACCLLGALGLGGAPIRRRLLRVGAEAAGAAALVMAVAVPYVVAAVRNPPRRIPWQIYERTLAHFSTDLAGTVVPRTFTLAGGQAAAHVSSKFVASRAEDGSYFGIAFLLVLILFAVWRRRERSTWLLLAALGSVLLLAMGPVLHVLGKASISLPWSLFARLPGLGQALPARLTMYAWLIAAIIVARFLAGPNASTGEGTTEGATETATESATESATAGANAGPPSDAAQKHPRRGARVVARWGLVALAALSIAPAVPPAAPVHSPSLFRTGMYARYVRPGEVVLTLPFVTPDPALLWQAEAHFAFRLAGGYVGGRAIPPAVRDEVAFRGLVHDLPWRVPPAAFRSFLIDHHVGAVILTMSSSIEWRRLLRAVGARPKEAGGVLIFRLPAVMTLSAG